MEENSEAHMETDVSSTTDDIPEIQEVTGSRGDMEMVIVVEQVKEEDDSSIDLKDEQAQGSRINSASTSCEASPQKETTTKNNALQPLLNEKNVSKQTLISLTNNSDSQKMLGKTSPVKQQPESSDLSTTVETNVSPSKNIEKAADRSPIKISQFQKIIQKSPFKDVKLISKSPIKVARFQEQQPKEFAVQEKSPVKINFEKSEEVNLQKTSKEVKLQEKGPNKVHLQENNIQGILQEKSSNKGINASNTCEEMKSHENSLTTEKKSELTTNNKIIESNSNKKVEPTSNIKLIEPTSNEKVIEPTSVKKINESTSNKKLDEPTSTKEVVEPMPTKKVVELTNKTVVEPTSTKNVVEPTSTKKLVESTFTKIPIDPICNIGVKLPENSKREEKLVKKSGTDDKLLDSTTQSKDTATGSSKTNDKDSSHDIIKTDNDTVKTVNGKDKTVSTVLLEDDDINDSQDCTDISEKEHNKSISRELKSLINSAKESKIISECTQLKSKTRKSRSQLDASNTSLNISLESEKIGNRRGSTNSQVSNCSEKSDKALKRSMRSQNPEFVSKCKQFLNSVTSKVTKDSDEAMSEDESNTNTKEKAQTRSEHTDSSPTSPKKKKVSDQPVLGKSNNNRSDSYCWRCHWTVEQEENDKAHPPMHCTVCPRAYHYKCLSANERKIPTEKNWVCPDCMQILQAESSDTRSPAMKKTSLGMLCDLLKYALERMMDLNGVEPFMHPVDRTTFPDYDKYVVHPMDLSQMKQNIADGHYGSTEAFVADAQWILHNSIIFNTLQSKLTGGARALVRSCRAEMGEIEACPECYAAAHARKPTWFTDVCTTPHILLWAKLKGFPYWPAKGMTVNSSGLVDVRFFGAHDRAWVPAKDCFLFSEKDPNNFRNKRQDILDAMQEAEQHIRNISRKYGKFVYPPFKTQFDPSKLSEQLKMMIPSFEGEIKTPIKEKPRISSPHIAKEKRRSTSKGSKSSANDGDASECEDTSTSARTEMIRVSKDSGSEKVSKADSPSVLKKPSSQAEETIATRKRRRSNLEEARIMTVIESTIPEKKSKNSIEQKKTDQQEPSSSKEEKAQLILKEAEITEATSKKKIDTPKSKSKDEEPSSSTMEEKESLRVTPIKLVALPRHNKQTPKLFTATKVPSKPGTPKEDDKTPQRAKSARSDKSSTGEKAKEDKAKAQKRRNSRANRSLNSSSTPKSTKTADKKTDDNDSTSGKELRPRENKKKEIDGEANKVTESKSLLKPIDSPKPTMDRLKFDDDTILAVIARDRRRSTSTSGLPTISNVCSLSTIAQSSTSTATPTTSAAQIEITVEASSTSSIFTPTSTDSVLNMKDAVTKLQKLRDNTEPVVGRVGVRAFARMTSPGRNDDVEVEIKAEPVDLEEADESRQSEKMDLMNACKLQPVNPPQSLREVRINRVVVGPSSAGKKGEKVEARPRARKTFPQPRRDEGRSELNGKNSMVYIPIQPPATQPPVRPARPTLPVQRPVAPIIAGNNAVNTVITPLKPSTSTISSLPSSVSAITSPVAQVSVPTVRQVPTAVHTVPLMTSVNGQWMFSLQPVMSVGGIDSTSTPMVNGLPDRSAATPTAVPLPTATPTATAPATPAQNKAHTDTNTPSELPRLQQRPSLSHPLDAAAGPLHAPASAGPATAKLSESAAKLSEFFRTLLEETLEKIDEPGAAAATLRLQLEAARWRHAQELDELRHNHVLTLAEMRLTFEKEKMRMMTEAKRAAQIELEAAVKEAKSKQWCANCNQEAQFYCCWNTAYCDYPCQRAHWSHHYVHCAQKPQDGSGDGANPSESRLQPQPDILPKSVPAATPALTVGGKLAARPQQDPAHQKASIIVSMVEDNSGTPTLKCVGTYKQGPTSAQVPPLVVNKQVITDDPSKKVVTSGGYLIVGASGNTTSVITPAPTRRSHAIQYFT